MASPQLPPPPPLLCSNCRAPGATIAETLPLCAICRQTFSRLRMPKPFFVFIALIGLIVLYNVIRIPFSIRDDLFPRDQTAVPPKAGKP